MKLRATVLVLTVAALGTACSSGGSGGSGGRTTPKGVSQGIVDEYSKPQTYNAKAVQFLASQTKKSNKSLPSTEILLKNDTLSDAFKSLDDKGKYWFKEIGENCTVTNPPKQQGQEQPGSQSVRRTESIKGGASCPIRYQQTESVDIVVNDTPNLVTMSGGGSVVQSLEILDADMRSDTNLSSSNVSIGIKVQGDMARSGDRVTEVVMKTSADGKIAFVFNEGVIEADFKMEMSIAGNENSNNVEMVAVAVIHTPEGDLSLGMRMKNQTMEFRLGGRVVTQEELKEIFGPALPTNPATSLLASGQ